MGVGGGGGGRGGEADDLTSLLQRHSKVLLYIYDMNGLVHFQRHSYS